LLPVVAIVGRPNVGKSTLFNLLTGSDAYAADQLFATLDPTVRRLQLPHTPEIVLADTVGFVRDLPHELVAAFRSAMKDFVDVAVYFSIGVTITALFNTGIAPGAAWLDSLAGNEAAAPAALMALAFILSLCSTSDAFIAATLDKFSWGAKLAFLTFGPMMDVKLIFLYQTVMKKRFIVLLGLGLFFAIGGISVFWQHLIYQAK